MKIIFENEIDKNDFMNSTCPGKFNLPEFGGSICNPNNCEECWKRAGCKLDVERFSEAESLLRIARSLEHIDMLLTKDIEIAPLYKKALDALKGGINND